MRFIADLHIHSRYSRATSKEGNPENYFRWACLKGVTVVGSGDFTHPGWFEELKEKLEPDEEGLYRLKPSYQKTVEPSIPPSCRSDVRFLLSVEISCIYKKNGRTRKIHNLVMMPDFEAAERFSHRLGEIGNIRSDGRPILGLDSRDLLEIALEAHPDVLFIPAHIWTPHFSLFGANSGFDTFEECFEDLTPHVFAVETGLSSDPPMNWRLSVLDNYALVSHSDAHSPSKLAREANLFDTELSFPAIRSALEDRDPARFLGTLEFYPEEGKYHYDGHRTCGLRWRPDQTRDANGICPHCGRKVTVGVLHRVGVLADRPRDVRPEAARHYESLVPLPEILASVLDMKSTTSKKVQTLYRNLLERIGPELTILRETPIDDLSHLAGPLIAEAVRRIREREVHLFPGYDGEYGQVGIFTKEERAHYAGQTSIFGAPIQAPSGKRKAKSDEESGSGGEGEKKPEPVGREVSPAPALSISPSAFLSDLNPEQQAGVTAQEGPVVIAAGPGTGKTRTLTCRIAHLILHQDVAPDQICAVTFTNRAAGEMRRRVRGLLPDRVDLSGLTMGTFHGIALNLLREYGGMDFEVLDALEARDLVEEILSGEGIKRKAVQVSEILSRAKGKGIGPGEFDGPEEIGRVYREYQRRLRVFHLWDYDDLLFDSVRLFEERPDLLSACRERFAHLLVDEFQDVNFLQYRLVQLFAGDGRNLFVIGDPDQAIYGFRGADYRYFSRLREDFQKSRLIRLETNYRSVGRLLQAATAVIGHNPDRVGGALTSTRGPGEPIRLLRPASELGEGIAIVREIGRMVGGATMLQAHGQGGKHPLGNAPSGERSFGDVAVLFRTGRQADVLEECFLKEGIPYRIVGQKSFLEKRSVRDLLNFFRAVVTPEDDFRLRNALRIARFHPGSAALETIHARQKTHGGCLIEALPSASSDKLRAFLDALERMQPLIRTEATEPLLLRGLEETGIEQDEALERLLRIAARCPSISDFLRQLPLYLDGDYERVGGKTSAPKGEAVSLMTLHAAKGSEFPVVFIAGAEDGLIPYRETRRGTGAVPLAEERRLFYVGVTRAQDELVLLAARGRMRYGVRVQHPVSPFIRDIPEDLIREEQIEEKRRKPGGRQLGLW